MPDHILAIDQGTTSSRAILFDDQRRIVASAQQELAQHYPGSGLVEHDPEDIWRSTLETCREAIAKSGAGAREIAAIGITNQRETTVLWDRETGKPIHNAIVWQDRRTAEHCDALKAAGHEAMVQALTGLLLDPYFSGTKISWLLEHVRGAHEAAEAGRLAFGTIDSFLLWRLTGGRVHATDATNASRTLLYDIHRGRWDDALLDLFNVPASILPDVRNSADDFGETAAGLFDAVIPIRGIAGDQHAATIGQACFEPGMIKSTYGTGCFALLNTGEDAVASQNRLLTTIAYQLDGVPAYALEGSIFVAGAAVQWLRDGLKIIADAAQSGALAPQADATQAVYLVPAFVGLGAPYWDADARGGLFGLTRNTGPAEIARAALESVGYQTRDLMEAMRRDWAGAGSMLRVDGGMAASDWTMQFVADMLGVPVDRAAVLETTASGAAYLAGLQRGLYAPPNQMSTAWERDRRFEPRLDGEARESRYAGWRDAVQRVLTR